MLLVDHLIAGVFSFRSSEVFQAFFSNVIPEPSGYLPAGLLVGFQVNFGLADAGSGGGGAAPGSFLSTFARKDVHF